MSKIIFLDFDDRNRAFVSEERFREYLQATAEEGDYERAQRSSLFL